MTCMRSIRLITLSMLLSFNALGQDCLTEAQLENTSTKTIPTDGSCDSPADDNTVCNITSFNLFDIDGTTTVLSCVTLNLADASGDALVLFGTMTIEQGATVNIDQDFIVSGGTLIVNGTLTVGNGIFEDDFAIESGGNVVINPTGSINVTNGIVDIGGFFGSAGSLTVDGVLTQANGDLSNGVFLNSGGTLSGNGLINLGEPFFDDGGTKTGVFGTCLDGSTVSCGSAPLPVELLDFTVRREYHTAQLQWETATELNNEGFEIQKSFDGLSYFNIGYVPGHGTVTTTMQYTFRDPNIRQTAYYRLKQVDFDGAYEYSPVAFLAYGDGEQLAIDVYPNPTASTIHLSGPASEVFGVLLYDPKGGLLLRERELTLDQIEDHVNRILATIDSQVLILKINNATSSSTQRILKVR